MKFECEKCRQLVDEKDVIIVFEHAYVVGTSIYAYCQDCYEKVKQK